MLDTGYLRGPILLLILLVPLYCWPKAESDSAEFYLSRVTELLNRGKEDSLRRFGDKGLHFARQERNTEAEIRLLYYIASTYNYSNRIKAQQMFRSALNLARANQYDIGVMLASSQLSLHSRWKGDFDSSIYYLDQADSILYLQEEGRRKNLALASSYNSRGNIYKQQGTYEKALAAYYEALALVEQEQVPHSIATYAFNVGQINFLLSNYEDARTLLRKSMSHGESADNQQIVAWCLSVFGDIALAQSKVDSAIFYFRRSIFLAEANGNSSERETLMKLAKAYIEAGMIDSARHFTHSLYDHMDEDDRLVEAQIGELESRLLIQEGNFKAAIQKLTKVRSEAQDMSDLDLELSALKFLIQAFEGVGDTQGANDMYPAYLALYDTILNQGKIKAVEELKAKYETEKKEQAIASLSQQNEIKDLKISQQQILLISAIAIFILLAGLGYFIYKQRQLVNDQRQLSLEQGLLRAQMNPHFIFNALNSIQSFITSNQGDDAVVYLAKFGELTRDILEASGENWIPLEKELKIIQNYLDLENARFRKGLKLELKVEVEDEEHLLVPPMMIQPFLENAIRHGFSRKQDGTIWLQMTEGASHIHVRVKDNGMGLIPTKEGHRSKAIEITNRRLSNILSKKQLPQVRIYNDQLADVIKGVIVEFQFPVNYEL